MSARNLDKAQRDAVLARIAVGEKYEAIARDVGASQAWVGRLARKHGYSRLPGGPHRKARP